MRVRLIVMAALAAAAAFGACTQVGTDPNVVVSLAFDSLPYPAVVAGDTLRDENGVARALHASALNSSGKEVAGAPVQYLVLDSAVTVTSGGFVVSTDTSKRSAHVLAQVGTLQSRTVTIVVTPRPDSLAAAGTVDTVRYVLADNTTQISAPITLQIVSRTPTTPAPVGGWIVRFSVAYHGVTLPANDAATAWLVDESSRRSQEETTASDGTASRRLRFVAAAMAAGVADSLEVTATAIARGAPLAGSPVKVVIHVAPR